MGKNFRTISEEDKEAWLVYDPQKVEMYRGDLLHPQREREREAHRKTNKQMAY
jgi:hypothetical protein